jgi:hypothetical protein
MRTISTQTPIEQSNLSIFTDHNHLKQWLRRLGLSIGLSPNEAMIRGNAEMGKIGRWKRPMNTLPGPKVELSLAKANLRTKDSSHVNIQPLYGMLPAQLIKTLNWFGVSLVSIIGYTVIEGDFATYILGITIITYTSTSFTVTNSIINTWKYRFEGHSIAKWGNLVKSAGSALYINLLLSINC